MSRLHGLTSMPVRFALYGFLKNQVYFEPFILLALLEKGLDFSEIGIFFAVRHLAVEILEIPTGMLSDLWGRRASLVVGWISYITSFLVFHAFTSLAPLLAGAVLYGLGDAMRTGTHKALIFSWLKQQGRLSEKVGFYGFTRSWSRYGSAAGIVIATAVVLVSGSYQPLFSASVIPYVAGLALFFTYPASLEPPRGASSSRSGYWRTLRQAFSPGTLRLLAEGMGFDGVEKALEPYAQPLLEMGGAVVLAGMAGKQGGTVFLAVSYLVIHILSGIASRSAGAVAARLGGPGRASVWMWVAFLTLYLLGLVVGLTISPLWAGLAVLGALLLQNLWRPVYISRFTASVPDSVQATMLSVESQARSLGSAAVALAAGLIAKHVSVVAVLALPVITTLMILPVALRYASCEKDVA